MIYNVYTAKSTNKMRCKQLEASTLKGLKETVYERKADTKAINVEIQVKLESKLDIVLSISLGMLVTRHERTEDECKIDMTPFST